MKKIAVAVAVMMGCATISAYAVDATVRSVDPHSGIITLKVPGGLAHNLTDGQRVKLTAPLSGHHLRHHHKTGAKLHAKKHTTANPAAPAPGENAGANMAPSAPAGTPAPGTQPE